MSQPKTSPSTSPSRDKAGSSVAACTSRSITVKLVGGAGYDPIRVRIDNEGKDVKADTSARFEVAPDAAGVELVITVPRPSWAGEGVKDEPPNEVIRTKLREVSPCDYVLEPRHVRLTVRPLGAVGSKAAAVEVEVDLRFLNVTRYFMKGDPNLTRIADKKSEQSILGPLDPAFNDPPNEMERCRTPLAHFQLFELTTGEHPKLWAATWPMKTLLMRPYGVTLFLMPKGDPYEHPGEANFNSLRRYLLTPARNAPFFVAAPVNNGNMGTTPFDLAVPVQGTHPLAHEMAILDPNVPGAFIDQVVESGKDVLCVLPLPNGAGDGIWGPLVTKKDRADDHLDGLRVAAHAFTAKDSTVSRTRQSVGGFSAGAQPAYLVLKHNPKAFDGFFWFDVPRTAKTQHDWLRAWIDGDGARKVWLIGGVHHAKLGTARKTIDRDARVKLLPATAAHYTDRSSAYALGVSLPPRCPGWVTLELEPTPTSKKGGVHAATNVFGEVVGPAEIKLKIVDGGTTVTKTARSSSMEALGLLVFKFRIRKDRKHIKVETKSDLEDLVEFIETDVENHRHQWVIGGGESFGVRGLGFVSFFGRCIRDWAP